MENQRHYYCLDEAGEPVEEPDRIRWAYWMEDARASLAVGHDLVAGTVDVVTSYVGFSCEKPPKLWQTQVTGGLRDRMEWYRSRHEALIGHEAMVAVVQQEERRHQRDGAKPPV